MVATRYDRPRARFYDHGSDGLPLPNQSEWVALDIETTGLNHLDDIPVLVSLYDGENTYVVDVRESPRASIAEWLHHCTSDRLVIGHNIEFDLRFLHQYYNVGYPRHVHDTMIAERILTAGKFINEQTKKHQWRTSLAAVVERRYGLVLDKTLQTSFTRDEPISPEQIEYASEDIVHLPDLTDLQQAELKDEWDIYELEMACIAIFAEMSRIGVRVSLERLRPLIAETEAQYRALRDELQLLLTPLIEWKRMADEKEMEQELAAWLDLYKEEEAKISELWRTSLSDYDEGHLHLDDWDKSWFDRVKGLNRFVRYKMSAKEGCFRHRHPRPPKPKRDTEPINIASQPQMMLAFKELGIDIPDYRTKTLATAALETDNEEHRRIIQLVLECKKAKKLIDAFGEKLIARIWSDGRLHGGNNQIGTATGRPSGIEPNLYQMPRVEAFRRCFIPEDNYLFVICDYNQMEMRIVAQLSRDETMQRAFREERDLHTYTAELMFKTDAPTKDQRHTAKTINFGILYGMGGRKLRQELAAKGVFMSVEEAFAAVALWKNTYPQAAAWIQRQGTLATTQGYTSTPFGRKRHFDLSFSNEQEKFAAARAGANHPIQGTNADCTKLAMVLMNERIQAVGGRIILQIYDEVVVEVPRDYASYAKEVVAMCMKLAGEQVIKDIPCRVDAVISTSWAEGEKIG